MQAFRSSSARKDPVQRIASLVQSTILLREALTALPSLAGALEPAKSELLKAASHYQAVHNNTCSVCCSLRSIKGHSLSVVRSRVSHCIMDGATKCAGTRKH